MAPVKGLLWFLSTDQRKLPALTVVKHAALPVTLYFLDLKGTVLEYLVLAYETASILQQKLQCVLSLSFKMELYLWCQDTLFKVKVDRMGEACFVQSTFQLSVDSTLTGQSQQSWES